MRNGGRWKELGVFLSEGDLEVGQWIRRQTGWKGGKQQAMETGGDGELTRGGERERGGRALWGKKRD